MAGEITMKTSPRLSKSRLLSFLQCPRRLWLEVHQPELAKPSAGAQAVMSAGNLVGDIARRLHPGGLLIEHQDRLSEALAETQQLITQKPARPLFEATFQHEGVLIRADLLLPDSGSSWHAVEVKSSTQVKDYHVTDAAIQKFVMAGAGVPVADVAVQVINRDFVYPGDGCYEEVRQDGTVNSLFMRQDVTAQIAPLAAKDVPEWIAAARSTATGAMPETTSNCDKPFECPFKSYCHPETSAYPVECLPRIGGKAVKLREQGYADIRDIPDGILGNETQEWVRRVTIAGQPELRPAAGAAMSELGYPRHYLDFETIAFAVPVWKGTRPYQQIPFQWSCHVEQEGGLVSHHEFLDLTGNDPRRPFAEALIQSTGEAGPVLVYNQSFEERIIRDLAAQFDDLAPQLLAIAGRIVDLLPIARNNYYHPDMRGSWSIKSVLPTIDSSLDYSQLIGVQHGVQAQQAYAEAIDPRTDEEHRVQLGENLLAYCQRDTEAMMALAWFFGQANGTTAN